MSMWKMRGTYCSGARVCCRRVLSTADWSTVRQCSGMLIVNGPWCLHLSAVCCCNCWANLFTFRVFPTPARCDFITLTQHLTDAVYNNWNNVSVSAVKTFQPDTLNLLLTTIMEIVWSVVSRTPWISVKPFWVYCSKRDGVGIGDRWDWNMCK